MSGTPALRLGILPFRRCVQAGAALFMIALPFANAAGFHKVSGNFLAFDLFGLPLSDPLSSAQAALAGSSAAGSLLLGAGLVLLAALLLGRVFCSWLCPYGLLSELIFSLRGKLGSPALADPAGSRGPGGPAGAAPRLLLALVGLLCVAWLLPAPYLNQLSLPGWYSRAAQHAAFYGAVLWGVLLIPALLSIEFFAGKRLWCRYLCPQSALLSLMALAPGVLRLRFSAKNCTCRKDDRPCMESCSLNLNPRKITAMQRLECTNCGDCVDACRPRGQALKLRK